MKLNETYSKKVPKEFFKEFIGQIKQYPLGSMPKRDLDCLIFYLLKKHGLIRGTTIRERAYNLNISETRYRSYLVDADAKFGKRDQKKSVRKIFDKLKKGESGVSVEGDTLVFFEDDPVVREDFVEDMKSAGFYTDSSFNEALVRVKAASFLLYALKKGHLNGEAVLAIFNSDKADKDKLEALVNSQKTAQDIMEDVLDIFKNHGSSCVETAAALLGYAPGVIKAIVHKKKEQ